MKHTMWSVVILVILGGVAAAYYYWQTHEPQQTPPRSSTETQPAPAAKVEPPIRHPIQEAQSPAEPLPPLNESDAVMQDRLTGFFGKPAVDQLFDVKDIVRRFVVTVDNLPRKKVPMRYRLFKPAAGLFLATGDEQTFFLNPHNYQRYTPYVLLAEAVDIKTLVATYVHFYPLFQQEYQNLGYPTAYFNDRLVEAIDDMLTAPDIQGQIKLVRPNVLYQFADPDLEARSAGQKIVIRMGSENAARIKARLREFRRELTGQPLKP